MKKNIFILLVGLLSCQLTVFARELSVTKIDVEIKSDTTIVVRNLFGADCKLYGDIILLAVDKTKHLSSEDNTKTEIRKYTQYGGDTEEYFNNRMKEANGNNEEYKNYVSRNNNGIVINLGYDNFPDTGLKLNFYGVLFDDKLVQKDGAWKAFEWCRNKDKIYTVSIKRGTNPYKDPIKESADSNLASTEKIEEIIENKIKCKWIGFQEKYTPYGYAIGIICLIILVSLIVIYVRIKKLNDKIEDHKTTSKESRSQIKSEDINISDLKLAILSKIDSKELLQKISNDDIINIINSSEIQLYIQTIITAKVEEYLRNNNVIKSIPANNPSCIQPSTAFQPELRTTKVEYRSDNNCFVISENSQNKIFEIYSINGEYYYTIVNDASIRKEMLGFITAFSGYVETRQVSPIPSTVEVIRDGRLIKNGDMYIVDTNCILQVSLM